MTADGVGVADKRRVTRTRGGTDVGTGLPVDKPTVDVPVLTGHGEPRLDLTAGQLLDLTGTGDSRGSGSSVGVDPDSLRQVGTDRERLVKSAERVRDLGEVFTPAQTVADMLDLIPAAMWAPHPSATFLEPACGDGNFLVAILDRKLRAVELTHAIGELPAGDTVDALVFHALEALASIYAIDISVDNIVGGVPGHEVGARDRLLSVLRSWHLRVVEKALSERSTVLKSARWIVEHNVLVGNMLATTADGTPTGRERLPLVEYDWKPLTKTVALATTTLGAVMAEAEAETEDVPTLFAPPPPKPAWQGKTTDLHRAPITAPGGHGHATRNGRGGR